MWRSELTFLGQTNFHLVLDDNTDDRQCGTEIDQQGKEKVTNRDQLVNEDPQRFIRRLIIDHTHRTLSVVNIHQRFDQDEFIGTRNKNQTDEEEHQRTSDTRLSEPMFVQEHGGVNTFDGD